MKETIRLWVLKLNGSALELTNMNRIGCRSTIKDNFSTIKQQRRKLPMTATGLEPRTT